MSSRTPMQTIQLILGAVILLGGLACVVAGFVGFASASDDLGSGDESGNLMLFAAGGFAMVIGFGIIAFTRSAVMSRNGGYRVTIEQGSATRGGGRYCSACGRPVSVSARFCDSCGAAVG
ncbi:MAG: zinc ribbon domain-containing protein [Nocardioides sp.]